MNLIKPYFILANCLLLILMAYLGVRGTYGLASTRLLKTRPQITADKPENSPAKITRRPMAYYTPIEQRNLFDVKSTKIKTVVPVDLETLEQTDLKLKLWGTVLGTYQENSYAVIEDLKTRAQNLYRQGDAIQDAGVKMILREKVILRVNDKDEILEMEKVQEAGVASLRPEPSQTGPPREAIDPRSQKISLQRSQIDEALANVNDLMQQVRVMPHFDNGQPDGFRLSGIKTDSLIRKMGLRNGDIITGVNGQPIQTMDDALGFYKQLSGASNVSIQMKRRNRERTIEYDIK